MDTTDGADRAPFAPLAAAGPALRHGFAWRIKSRSLGSAPLRSFFICLLPVVTGAVAGPCFAGATLGTNELEILLRQQPAVHEALESSIKLSETAYAETRLGPHFAHLGGARVGPYTVRGMLKQSHKEIELVLCTEADFIDAGGAKLTEAVFENAVRVEERLTAVVLRERSDPRPACP